MNKKLYFAVYSIQDIASFKLHLIEAGIQSRSDAEYVLDRFTGYGVIIEYYE